MNKSHLSRVGELTRLECKFCPACCGRECFLQVEEPRKPNREHQLHQADIVIPDRPASTTSEQHTIHQGAIKIRKKKMHVVRWHAFGTASSTLWHLQIIRREGSIIALLLGRQSCERWAKAGGLEVGLEVELEVEGEHAGLFFEAPSREAARFRFRAAGKCWLLAPDQRFVCSAQESSGIKRSRGRWTN